MTQITRTTLLWTLLLSVLALPGCEAIGKIFKAGVWTGVIMVAVVLALVGGALTLMRRT
jgi:hypothetical protein